MSETHTRADDAGGAVAEGKGVAVARIPLAQRGGKGGRVAYWSGLRNRISCCPTLAFGPLGVDEGDLQGDGRSSSAAKKDAADTSGSGSPGAAHGSPVRERRDVPRRCWWYPAAARHRSRPSSPTYATPPDESRADRGFAGSLLPRIPGPGGPRPPTGSHAHATHRGTFRCGHLLMLLPGFDVSIKPGAGRPAVLLPGTEARWHRLAERA